MSLLICFWPFGVHFPQKKERLNLCWSLNAQIRHMSVKRMMSRELVTAECSAVFESRVTNETFTYSLGQWRFLSSADLCIPSLICKSLHSRKAQPWACAARSWTRSTCGTHVMRIKGDLYWKTAWLTSLSNARSKVTTGLVYSDPKHYLDTWAI